LSGKFEEDQSYQDLLGRYRKLFMPENIYSEIKTPISKSFISSLNME
jgi:hypothetical protein